MSAKLTKCPKCGQSGLTEKGLKTHRCKAPARKVQVEVVGDGNSLPEIATELEKRGDDLASWEQRFVDGTLPVRLQIGLQCLKAMEVFTLTKAEVASIGGEAKAAKSRRDSAETPAESQTGLTTETAEPASFSDWLETAAPWLKKPTAYKYAEAVKGLSLDHRATPEVLDMTLETLRHSNETANLPAPSLASLIRAAGANIGDGENEAPPLPEDKKLLRIGDARETFQKLRDTFETSVTRGQLDDLPVDDLKELDEFFKAARDRIKARLKP